MILPRLTHIAGLPRRLPTTRPSPSWPVAADMGADAAWVARSPAPAIHIGGLVDGPYCTMIVPVMPRVKCTEQ